MNRSSITPHDIDTHYTHCNNIQYIRETKKIELRDQFSEDSVKEYLKKKFNVNPALVDEIYSGRRKGSVIPLSGGYIYFHFRLGCLAVNRFSIDLATTIVL